MKEIYAIEKEKGIFEVTDDRSEAEYVVLLKSTYDNLIRIHRERSNQKRGLSPKHHSGYAVRGISPFNEAHAKVRVPREGYESWDVEKIEGMEDIREKLAFLQARKETQKSCKVDCYLVDIQTPYVSTIPVETVIMLVSEELSGIILPGLGYENTTYPEFGSAPFKVEWEKVEAGFRLKRTVYRMLLIPGMQARDKYWHISVFATGVPDVPEEMMPGK